jgi:hypothetical protein
LVIENIKEIIATPSPTHQLNQINQF